jgi:hypothetical protein
MWFLIAWLIAWFFIAIAVGWTDEAFSGVATFFLGGVVLGLFVVLGVLIGTESISTSKYTLVSNEKVYYSRDSGQNDQRIKIIKGSDGKAQLMIVGAGEHETYLVSNCGLHSITVSTDNEFYLQKITRHLERGWFNFGNTTEEWNLVLPKTLGLEIN